MNSTDEPDSRIKHEPRFRARKGLPFLYFFSFAVSLPILYFYRHWNLLTRPVPLLLFPLWIFAGHLLCGLSYVITSLSPRKGWRLFRHSWIVYTKRGSPSFLQVSFLTSLLEETFFRYFLLTWLSGLLRNPWLACLITSLLFSIFHLRHGFTLKSAFLYLDFFLFSLIISSLNLLCSSIYPAFFIHGIRNYILKVMFISRDEFEALHREA